jgi:hypothetical protein
MEYEEGWGEEQANERRIDVLGCEQPSTYEGGALHKCKAIRLEAG